MQFSFKTRWLQVKRGNNQSAVINGESTVLILYGSTIIDFLNKFGLSYSYGTQPSLILMMHFFTYSRIFPRIFIFLWFFAHHDFDPQERDCQILKVLVWLVLLALIYCLEQIHLWCLLHSLYDKTVLRLLQS